MSNLTAPQSSYRNASNGVIRKERLKLKTGFVTPLA